MSFEATKYIDEKDPTMKYVMKNLNYLDFITIHSFSINLSREHSFMLMWSVAERESVLSEFIFPIETGSKVSMLLFTSNHEIWVQKVNISFFFRKFIKEMHCHSHHFFALWIKGDYMYDFIFLQTKYYRFLNFLWIKHDLSKKKKNMPLYDTHYKIIL